MFFQKFLVLVLSLQHFVLFITFISSDFSSETLIAVHAMDESHLKNQQQKGLRHYS